MFNAYPTLVNTRVCIILTLVKLQFNLIFVFKVPLNPQTYLPTFLHQVMVVSFPSFIEVGSVAEWLACWTRAQKGLGSNRSRDAVGCRVTVSK